MTLRFFEWLITFSALEHCHKQITMTCGTHGDQQRLPRYEKAYAASFVDTLHGRPM